MEQTKTKISETIVTGRKFRRLVDNEAKNWDRFCGWNKPVMPFKHATPMSSKEIHEPINGAKTTVCVKKRRKRIALEPETENWEKICITPYGLYNNN